MPVPSLGIVTALACRFLMLDLELCVSFSWALSSIRFPRRNTLTQKLTCKQFIKRSFQKKPVRDLRQEGAKQECTFRSSPSLSLNPQFSVLEHTLCPRICLDSRQGCWAVTLASTSTKVSTLLVLWDGKCLREDLVLILHNFWGPGWTSALPGHRTSPAKTEQNKKFTMRVSDWTQRHWLSLHQHSANLDKEATYWGWIGAERKTLGPWQSRRAAVPVRNSPSLNFILHKKINPEFI